MPRIAHASGMEPSTLTPVIARIIFRNTEEYLPFYDLSAVAQALDIQYRQLDNMLSRNDLAGVERKKRGVTRRLTTDAVVVIHLAWELASGLKMSIGDALQLAADLERAPGHDLAIGRFATLRVDVSALRASTLERLNTAVELVGRRRRGRPVGQATMRSVRDG